MRILTVLTYYRPHTSGLTIYAERLAKAFARRGHQVTVMTTRYDRSLPAEEVMDQVRVIRVPVTLRISKGVIAPTFGWMATKLVLKHDVIHLHLPQFDAPGVALRGRLLAKPVVLTYHCDLQLPISPFNRLVNKVVDIQNIIAGIMADHLVTYTQDYADHSPYLSRFRQKLTPILPPVVLPETTPTSVEAFAQAHQTRLRRPVIGMVTRFAAEKGVEILLDSLPGVLQAFPQAQVLFAGQHQNVFGEKSYSDKLMPRIREYEQQGKWTFLGNLTQQELTAFYSNIDVLVVPSLNSTEAFGLVQVEAMMHNVPCVASSLPGVRRPIQMHHMGQVIPIGDPAALADAMINIITHRDEYRCDATALSRLYDPDAVAAAYEALFDRIRGK